MFDNVSERMSERVRDSGSELNDFECDRAVIAFVDDFAMMSFGAIR